MSIAVAPITLDVSLSVSDTPAPPLQFTLTAGIPGPAADLSPVLAAIAAAQTALADAVAGVASSIDFTPVEAALEALQAALAANLDATVSSRATPADVSAAQAALVAALADIQDAVLQEVQAGNVGVQEVIANVHLPAQLVQIEALLADLQTAIESALEGVLALLPPDVGADVQPRLDAAQAALGTAITAAADGVAAVVNATSDAVSLNIATAKTEILAELAAGTAAWPGEVRLFSNNTGNAPAGWTKLAASPLPKFNQRSAEIMATMPTTTGYPPIVPAIVLVVGQYIHYFTNGSGGLHCRYDTLTDQYEVRAAIPGATYTTAQRIHHIDGKLYVLGRIKNNASGVTTLQVQIYDIATDTWTTGPTISGTTRYGISSFVNSTGKIIIVGGVTNDAYSGSPTASTVVATAVRYDPAAGTMTTLTDAPTRIYAHQGRMNFVKGATRYFLLPVSTSDGTTLVTGNIVPYSCDDNGENWTAHDALESSSISIATAVWHLGADEFAWLPYNVPATGTRARKFSPLAASGSQWSNYDWQNFTYNSSGFGQTDPNALTPDMRLPVLIHSSGIAGLLYLGDAPATYRQNFYATKN
jgi:hypothetical protein